MGSPSVSAHTIAAANPGTSLTTTAINAPAGSSVYVEISEGNLGTSLITSVQDSLGNNLTKVASKVSSSAPPVSVYAIDNIAGSASYTVTVKVSSSQKYIVAVQAITGAANPSFDKAGSGGVATSYVSGTSESDSLSPSTASNLLILSMGGHGLVSSGSPTMTFGSETGETLLDSDTAIATTVAQGLGIYTEDATTTGSTSVSGKFTFGGTGASASAAWILVSITTAPSPAAGAGLSKARATGIGSGKGSGEGLSKTSTSAVGSGKGTGEGLSKTSISAIGSGKGTGEGLSSTRATGVASGRGTGEGLSKTSVSFVASQVVPGGGLSRASATAVAGGGPAPVAPATPALGQGTSFWLPGPHGFHEAVAVGQAEQFATASVNVSHGGPGADHTVDSGVAVRLSLGQRGTDNPLTDEYNEVLPEPSVHPLETENPLSEQSQRPSRGPTYGPIHASDDDGSSSNSLTEEH